METNHFAVSWQSHFAYIETISLKEIKSAEVPRKIKKVLIQPTNVGYV